MTDNNPNSGSTKEGVSRSDFAQLVHRHLNKYISLADTKASILLSALVAYLGISLSVIASSWSEAGSIFRISSAITILTALGAVYYAAKAVYPHTPETPQGLILWESIASQSREDYKNNILNNSEETLLEELIDENYKLAEVNVGKYRCVEKALWGTGLTVTFALLTVLIYIDTI